MNSKRVVYDVFKVDYDHEGKREYKFLEKVDDTTLFSNDAVIYLIGKGYLEPQDLPFVEVNQPKKTENVFNIIHADTNALIFRIEST